MILISHLLLTDLLLLKMMFIIITDEHYRTHQKSSNSAQAAQNSHSLTIHTGSYDSLNLGVEVRLNIRVSEYFEDGDFTGFIVGDEKNTSRPSLYAMVYTATVTVTSWEPNKCCR